MYTKYILAALAAVANADYLESLYAEFIAHHGKMYATQAEYEARFELFAKTYKEIQAFNSVPQTSTVGLNKFADWTEHEKAKLRNFVPRQPREEMKYMEVPKDLELPTEVNWITAGAVNPVRDQGQCGSCWAFSACAQMEGQHFIQSGELLDLSEQQCVDCDDESFGCNGGWQDNCMYYVQWNGGISTEAEYPYTAMNGLCWAPYNGPVDVLDVYHVESYSENALMAAIAAGPTSVTIDADSTEFYYYTSGVVSGTGCGNKLDHAVTAVGYGYDEETGLDYYLVRNSWGASWGDQGYIKMARNGDGFGVCGIQEISVWSMTN